MVPTDKNAVSCEVCILAGGLSSRMGRNKAKLRLGGKSLLTHAKVVAAALACPARIIRHDLVPRCGPLGGIYTALKTTTARKIIFLSCDMPFVPSGLLRRMLTALRPNALAVFLLHDGILGFPFLLRVQALPNVEELLREKRLALQRLAAKLQAKIVRSTRREASLLVNVNTPDDWIRARQLWTRLKAKGHDCQK